MIDKLILFIFGFSLLLNHQKLYAKSDSVSIQQCIDEARGFINKDASKAKRLLDQSLYNSRLINNKHLVAKSQLYLSQWFFEKLNEDSGTFYWNQSYSFAELTSNYNTLCRLFIVKANFFHDIGKLDTSAQLQLKALQFAQKSKDSSDVIRCLVNVGVCFAELGKHEEALNYWLQGYELSSIDIYHRAVICENLGNSYSEIKRYSKAALYYTESIRLFKTLNDIDHLLETKMNLGTIYQEMNKPLKAIEIYSSCISGFIKLNNLDNLCTCYENLGVSYLSINQTNKAIEYLNKANKLATELKDIYRISSTSKNLSVTYASIGNYKKAYTFQAIYDYYYDSLYSIESSNKIEEINTRYQTEKKEQAIIQLNIEKENEQKQKQAIGFAFLGFGVVTILLLYIFIQRYKRQKLLKEKNEEIHQQKISELIKSQELKSINAMLEGEERERERISADLHDRLGAILSTIKLGFSSMETKIGQIVEINSNQYNNTLKLIDEAVDEVRIISHNLASNVLVNFGLEVTLLDLKETIENNTPMRMNIVVNGLNNARLQANFEISLYRIIQELLNNCIKHAKATIFTIELNKTSSEILLIVSDNGVGFDLGQAKLKEGLGLKNLESRVLKLKGILHIDSGKGNGSTFIIEIPLI